VVDRGKVLKSGDVQELLRETNTYRLTVDSVAKSREVLDRMGAVGIVRESDGVLDVHMDGMDPASINRALVEAGVGVSGICPIRTSLEELYLGLVNGGDC
jgi:ABC-type uncharacterized transport system ATPase subunit